MKLDIQTLAIISFLTFLTQLVGLLIQNIVNRSYHGVRWWLLGSALWALGVIFMPTVNIPSLEMLALISNPLVVLGQIFLYVSMIRFLDKKENRWVLVSIFIVFTLSYYYFMFVYNDISGRTFVLTTVSAVISFMTASKLFINKDRLIAGSANFTAIVFFAYGCFTIVRTFIVVFSPPIRSYSDQGTMLELSFIVPIITSLLWSFGFVVMLNQRLNAENREEKEKMQLIFNTNPDAAMISRLNDGLVVDVNAGFLAMMGYTRAEIIKSPTGINIWHKSADRESFVNALKEKGTCENMESVFQRKDGSLLTGSISANTLIIQTVPHIISIVHDITLRKQVEQQIQQLVQQLEIEKKAALLNANTDSLTGLANRRYFDEALNTEFHRLKRAGTPLSLIMLDVDHFKKFNDHYGHLAGDDCLRQIGALLKTLVGRVTDMVARYGGEEFVAILTDTNQYGAATLAERIRKAVEALAIPHSGSDISEYVTVSLGVVTVYTTRLTLPEQVVALADEALYGAKEGGRNRISVSTENAISDNNPLE